MNAVQSVKGIVQARYTSKTDWTDFPPLNTTGDVAQDVQAALFHVMKMAVFEHFVTSVFALCSTSSALVGPCWWLFWQLVESVPGNQ